MLRERVITALLLAPLVLLVIFWVPHAVTMAAYAAAAPTGEIDSSGEKSQSPSEVQARAASSPAPSARSSRTAR